MNVALWAEIRRLAEIDQLSGRVIARRLHCSRHTVAAALELPQPPAPPAARRASLLDPYVEQIKELLAKYPDLSAVRIREEIARGPQGYTGSASVLRRYVLQVRPARGRVYQASLPVKASPCGNDSSHPFLRTTLKLSAGRASECTNG